MANTTDKAGEVITNINPRTKKEMLDHLINLNANIKATFKFPKVPDHFSGTLKPLSINDTDLAEYQVLRQFFINMNRVVPFNFGAYPEDIDRNKNFVGLHYHGLIHTEQPEKFLKVAPRKYLAVLRNVYGPNAMMPNQPLWLEGIEPDHIVGAGEYALENYALKRYCPSKRLVTDQPFRIKKSFKISQQ